MPFSSLTAATIAVTPAEAAALTESKSPPHRRAKGRRSWFAEFLFAPFKDVDERVQIRR